MQHGTGAKDNINPSLWEHEEIDQYGNWTIMKSTNTEDGMILYYGIKYINGAALQTPYYQTTNNVQSAIDNFEETGMFFANP